MTAEVGVEVVTTEDSPTRGALIGFALSGKNGRARYIRSDIASWACRSSPRRRDVGVALAGLFAAEGAALSAHDLKRSDVALAQAGLRLGRYGFDTLARQLLDRIRRRASDRVSAGAT